MSDDLRDLSVQQLQRAVLEEQLAKLREERRKRERRRDQERLYRHFRAIGYIVGRSRR